MAWTLQLPRATFVADHSRVDILLESTVRCSIEDDRSPRGEGRSIAFELTPWDSHLPLNIAPPSCEDAYVREMDLIAHYPQTVPWAFGYQIDWRYRAKLVDHVQCMEVWLSISTSMLESNPKLVIAPTIGMTQQTSSPISVAEHKRAALLVHPLDTSDIEIETLDSSDQVVRWEAFGGFMEKGVIRRARLLLAWSSRVEPPSTWDHLLNRFADSPLPLTA